MNFKKTIAGIMALAMLNCSLSATGVDFDFTQLQKVSASDSYSIDDFQIDENGVLVKYVGHANNVSIPSNVTYIGDEAFMGCTDLRTVKIPGSVKTIGECAFTVCSNLKTITLESGIESLKTAAFSGCKSLRSVTIPDSVTSIGKRAFSGCDLLNSVTFSKNLRSIGPYAFDSCWLKKVSVPKCCLNIGEYAFCNNHTLAEFTVMPGSEDLTAEEIEEISLKYPLEIGKSAFESDGIQKIEIPYGIETIGENLVYNTKDYGHEKLVEVKIPDSVKVIGKYAFSHCKNIKNFVVYSNEEDVTKITFTSDENLNADFSNIEKIGEYAFEYVPLVSVNIPSSAQIIGVDAFLRTNIEKVSIKSSKTEVCDYVFSQTPWVKEQTCSNSMCIISGHIQGTNDVSESIVIPGDVKRIPSDAFINFKNLKSVVVSEGVETIGGLAFGYCDSLETIQLPGTLKSIESRAFSGCTSLKSIDLPNSLTKISNNVFRNCDGLTSIEIPEGVEIIEFKAFYGCSNMKSVKLPSTLKKIGSEAFKYCYELEEINDPGNIEIIDYEAFDYCSKLKNKPIAHGTNKTNKPEQQVTTATTTESATSTTNVTKDQTSETVTSTSNVTGSTSQSVQSGTPQSVKTSDTVSTEKNVTEISVTQSSTFEKPVTEVSTNQTTSTEKTTSQVTTKQTNNTTASNPSFIYGDLNGDGVADLTDLTLLSVYLLDKNAGRIKCLEAADVDGNGSIDIADLPRFKQYISKDASVPYLGPKVK